MIFRHSHSPSAYTYIIIHYYNNSIWRWTHCFSWYSIQPSVFCTCLFSETGTTWQTTGGIQNMETLLPVPGLIFKKEMYSKWLNLLGKGQTAYCAHFLHRFLEVIGSCWQGTHGFSMLFLFQSFSHRWCQPVQNTTTPSRNAPLTSKISSNKYAYALQNVKQWKIMVEPSLPSQVHRNSRGSQVLHLCQGRSRTPRRDLCRALLGYPMHSEENATNMGYHQTS